MMTQRPHALRRVFDDTHKHITFCLVALVLLGIGCSDDAVAPDDPTGGPTADQSWLPVTALGGQIGFIDAVMSDGGKLY